MVSKPVAAAGSVLGLTALAMIISVMVSQNFVVVTIPGQLNNYKAGGAGTCQGTNYLGTLGIFTASYLPGCAFNPAVVPPKPEDEKNLQPYAVLSGVTTPTTEFGPLFPAQTCVGGKLTPYGCKFTTCDEFYAAASTTDKIANMLAVGKVVPGLRLANDVDAYPQVKGLATLVGAIPTLLAGAVAGSLAGNATDTTVYKIADSLTLVAGFAAQVTTSYTSTMNALVTKGVCALPDTLFTSAPNCAVLSGALKAQGGCTGTTSVDLLTLCAQLPMFNGANDDERIGNFSMGPSATVTGASVSQMGKFLTLCVGSGQTATVCGQAYGLYLSNNTAEPGNSSMANAADLYTMVTRFLSVASETATSAQIVSGSYPSISPGSVFTFSGLKAYLKPFSASLMPNKLGLAWASLAACSKSNAAECQDPANYGFLAPTAVPDTETLPACVLLDFQVSLATNTTMTAVANCTYTFLLTRLGSLLSKGEATVSAVLGARVYLGLSSQLSPLKVSDVPVILMTVAATCSGRSQAACPAALAAAPVYFNVTGIPLGIPADFNAIYPVAAGAFLLLQNFSVQNPVATPILAPILTMLTPPTFSNFLKTLGSAPVSTLITQFATVLPEQAKSLVDLIPVAKATQTCSDATCFATSLYDVGYAALQISPDRATRVADCLNNDKDISAFKTAQAMVTAAAVMMGLGMAAGFAALAVDKGPVAFGAGALSAIGGVLVVAALMVVKGAPVYSKIGGAEVAGKPLYSGASGQLIAIVGGLLAIIGGITQAVSGCLNKAGSSSDQLTTKVENTY
jgi:hypothetical protein